jgi:Helix-hairpin-helix domain
MVAAGARVHRARVGHGELGPSGAPAVSRAVELRAGVELGELECATNVPRRRHALTIAATAAPFPLAGGMARGEPRLLGAAASACDGRLCGVENREIADRLDSFASLLELADANPCTPRAHRRAAETIRSIPLRIVELVRPRRANERVCGAPHQRRERRGEGSLSARG